VQKKLEQQLDDLQRLLDTGPDEEGCAHLIRTLASGRNLLAAKAARVAGRHRLDEIAPALVQAFDRFMKDPAKSDPGCLAKRALVDALAELVAGDPRPFLRGVRHVQMEPAFGRPVDTADQLRASCARALYAMGYHDLLFELTDLLADPEVVPRTAAVDILVALADETSELLLRLKASSGDAEAEVLGACFSGLLAMAPERSVPFVAARLADPEAQVAAEAALALGETHREDALHLLVRTRDEAVVRDQKDRLLLPIALTRRDDALTYLLHVIAEEPETAAVEAVRALPALAGDDRRIEAVRGAVRARGLAGVTTEFTRAFDQDEQGRPAEG
jgi:HEAT repeat protein